MPLGKIKIISQKKANYGEEVEVNNYWFDETCEPLAVIYGCFSPFTGKYGHGRMLENAKAHGIKKFIIVSPPKREQIDHDRNMFTLEQKVAIAKAGCEDLGYDILDAYIGKWAFVLGNLNDIAAAYPENRIVLCCGPDRAEEYGKDMLQFDESRKSELPDPKNRGRYELLAMSDRGEKNVSGTKVRRMILDYDKEAFLSATGYSESIWALCCKYAEENGVIQESFVDFYLKEAMEATKRVGIKHLYNPGNSQELPQEDFIKILDVLDEDNGKLINGKNVSITEKSDGAAFRMGLDDEGKFFVEQSYSGPLYDAETILSRSEERYGKKTRLSRGWADTLDKLKNDIKIQKCLQEIYKRVGPFKMCGEIFITAIGLTDNDGYVRFVGSRYDKTKIGKDATIILFTVNDGEGNAVKNSTNCIKFMIKNATSESIKFDDAELNLDTNIEVDVGETVKQIKMELKKIDANLKKEGTSIKDVLNSKSRLKPDLTRKKEIKNLIEEQQGILNAVFEKQLENYQGKWGPDYEGIVIKLKDGSMIKITSKKFKEFKASHDDTMQHWLFDENFIPDFIKMVFAE